MTRIGVRQHITEIRDIADIYIYSPLHSDLSLAQRRGVCACVFVWTEREREVERT